MRIVYICADRGIPVYGDKGASVHIQEMVRAFIKLNHEVKIVCAKVGSNHSRNSALDVVAVAPTGETPKNREDKEREAIKTGDAIADYLRELYQQWPFDIIYERYSLWSSAGCRIGTELNIPTILEVNAPLVEEQLTYRQLELQTEARMIEKAVYRSATAIASVSKQMTRYLVEHGAPAERVFTVGNAVNTDVFTPRVRAAVIDGIEDHHFVVGFSGSLKMWHGIDILLLAFQQFHRESPDTRLLIVGDGPKRGWAEGFVAGAGLSDAVIFSGWMPHVLLPGYIARMDIATAPYPASDTHYFSPLKLYEYLAVGRPIVASRIGQTADLLADNKKALLIEPGSVEALTKALIELQRDPALASCLAKAAAKEGAKHDWSNNARRVIEIANTAEVVA